MYQPTSLGLIYRFFAVGLIFSLLAILMPASLTHAAPGINKQIPFDGSLKTSGGAAVTDGSFDMVFKIYDASTGGTTLWTGTHTAGNGNAVSVADGIFRVMLGSGAGNTLSLDFNNDSYYVGLAVEADSEMSPRYRLGAAGYAFNSDTLDGLDSTDFARAGNATTFASSTTFSDSSTFNATSTFNSDVTFAQGLTVASSTPATTTNSIYNLGGALYWNGSTIGGSSVSTLNDLTDVNVTAVNGSLVYYNGTTWDDIATSSLNINTDNLIEGSALFWTQARFNTAIAATTTDALGEGSTNLYYTNVRVAALITASTSISQLGQSIDLVTETTGTLASTSLAAEILVASELDSESELEAILGDVTNVFTNNDGALDDDDLSDNDTDDLSEGAGNLYWTDARFDTRLSATTTLPGLTILTSLATVGSSGATTTITGNLLVNEGLTLASSTPTITSNTLYNEAGTLYWNGSDISTPPSGTITTTNQSSSFTAVVNTSYQIDTTGAQIIVTLPIGGVDGDVVRIEDAKGNFAATSTLVLPGLGDTIEGSSGTTTLAISNAVNTFIYDADNSRWSLDGEIGESTALHYISVFQEDNFGGAGLVPFEAADVDSNLGISLDDANDRFDIIQAGLYQIIANASIRADHSSNQVDSDIQLIKNVATDNTIVVASEVSTIEVDGQGSRSGDSASMSTIVSLAVGDTISLNNVSGNQALRNVNITIRQLPSAVITAQAQAVEYMHRRATNAAENASVADDAGIGLDTLESSSGSGITYNTATNRFTLTAGKTYRITANSPWTTSGDHRRTAIYDVTNSVQLGAAGQTENTFGADGTVMAIFTTTVDTLIEYRNVTSVARSFGDDTDNLLPWMIIETIADGTLVQELGGASEASAGTDGFLSGAAAGEQGAVLLGDGTWSATSTLFLNASGTLALGAHEEITGGNSSNIADNSLVLGNGALCVDSGGLNCDDASRAAGTIYANNTSVTGVDLAENYPSNDDTLLPGELVVIDSASPSHIKRSEDVSEMLLGVISTKPGVLLGGYGDKEFEGTYRAPVALAGRVPVLFSVENGEVEPGDNLIMSGSKAGYAMAACGPEFCGSARSIGVALEAFAEDMNGDTALVAAELVEEAEEIEEAIEEIQVNADQLEAAAEAIENEIEDIVEDGGSLEEFSELVVAAEEVGENLEEAEAIEKEVEGLEVVVAEITEAITTVTGEGRLMVFIELGDVTGKVEAGEGFLGFIADISADIGSFVKRQVVAMTGFFDTLFAREIYTEQLCIGTGDDVTCITQDQLNDILDTSKVEPLEVPVVHETEQSNEELEIAQEELEATVEKDIEVTNEDDVIEEEDLEEIDSTVGEESVVENEVVEDDTEPVEELEALSETDIDEEIEEVEEVEKQTEVTA